MAGAATDWPQKCAGGQVLAMHAIALSPRCQSVTVNDCARILKKIAYNQLFEIPKLLVVMSKSAQDGLLLIRPLSRR
jgi:hypothetical protein